MYEINSANLHEKYKWCIYRAITYTDSRKSNTSMLQKSKNDSEKASGPLLSLSDNITTR